jgi:hypothetical protein
MKATHIFYWLMSMVLLPLSYGFQDQPATELVIKVQYPDGSAATGIKVQQAQLERTSPFPRNLVCGATNGEGRFTTDRLFTEHVVDLVARKEGTKTTGST